MRRSRAAEPGEPSEFVSWWEREGGGSRLGGRRRDYLKAWLDGRQNLHRELTVRRTVAPATWLSPLRVSERHDR